MPAISVAGDQNFSIQPLQYPQVTHTPQHVVHPINLMSRSELDFSTPLRHSMLNSVQNSNYFFGIDASSIKSDRGRSC